jgi:CBS domain-containing protein
MGRTTDAVAGAAPHDPGMHDELPEPGHHLTVGAVMTPFPVVVHRDAPLDEVAELLAQNDITGAPVVDGDGFLVGVISQTDLVRMAASSGPNGARWAGFTARHVMSHEPVTAVADVPLAAAVRRLERHGVHRLVIVADDGATPIGVVSITDLLPLLVDAADA